mgnify:CR=1 FL=1
MNERGLVITFEGGDGSGKGTQAEKTRLFASSIGKNVLKRSFPRYGEQSAIPVEEYLNGKYGELYSVPPRLVALAYAADRLVGTGEIINHIEQGPDHWAVLDRYDGSNYAYQGAKYEDADERHEFMRWLANYEREMGMLVPDKNFVMIVPPETAYKNVAKKAKRSYTESTHDLHESDTEYQARVLLVYKELCEMFPDKYIPIECTDADGNMRSEDEIQKDIQSRLGY